MAASEYVVKAGQLEARWPGGSDLLVQGDPVPDNIDADQLAHYIETDAVETPEEARVRREQASAAEAAQAGSTPESAAAAIEAAAARAAAAEAAEVDEPKRGPGRPRKTT